MKRLWDYKRLPSLRWRDKKLKDCSAMRLRKDGETEWWLTVLRAVAQLQKTNSSSYSWIAEALLLLLQDFLDIKCEFSFNAATLFSMLKLFERLSYYSNPFPLHIAGKSPRSHKKSVGVSTRSLLRVAERSHLWITCKALVYNGIHFFDERWWECVELFSAFYTRAIKPSTTTIVQ